MATACQLVPLPGQFASGMLGYLDCQAQTIGAQGYAALASPGSSASLLMTALLTIFIAIIGYRMLLGETPTLREGVLAFVKIGVVLAFATSWPAYQVIVYDVVLREPAELAAEIGSPAGLPGAAGGLPARLDEVDHGLRTLSIEGVGAPVLAAPQPSGYPGYEPPLWAGFDTFALGASRVVFLGAAIGGFALVRLAAGLLLALGPLFFAFLLFDGTRGLFEGWLRSLIGMALGALVTAILLGVELALLEPWVAELVGQRAAGQSIAGVPAPLFATTVIFAVVLGGLLLVVTRLALGLKLPDRLASSLRLHQRSEALTTDLRSISSARLEHIALESRSRAAAIADAVAITQRREEQQAQAGLAVSAGSAGTTSTGARAADVLAPVPLGQTFRRRTATRVSASSRGRDRS